MYRKAHQRHADLEWILWRYTSMCLLRSWSYENTSRYRYNKIPDCITIQNCWSVTTLLSLLSNACSVMALRGNNRQHYEPTLKCTWLSACFPSGTGLYTIICPSTEQQRMKKPFGSSKSQEATLSVIDPKCDVVRGAPILSHSQEFIERVTCIIKFWLCSSVMMRKVLSTACGQGWDENWGVIALLCQMKDIS